ncbi:MAG TPA: hypothetical protein VI141_02650 [Acidimicrobiia bacterium]
MATADDASTIASRIGSLPPRRAAIITSRLGIVQALLLIISVWIMTSLPAATASDAEIIEFYSSDRTRLILALGLYLMPFAAIAFLWFAVALRMWEARSDVPGDTLLSNVQLVSAIVFIALFLAGAAASTVLGITVELTDAPLETATAREFPLFGSALLLVFAMRMAAMFVFTTSGIARNHGLFPKWFIWSGYLVGVFLLLSPSLNPLLILAFPIWVLVLSVLLLIKARQLPA